MINLNNVRTTNKDLVYQIAYDTVAIVPVINPLAAILLVNAYRQSMFNICSNVHDQVFKQTTVTHIQPAVTSSPRLFTM